jgi:hypothetical protein
MGMVGTGPIGPAIAFPARIRAVWAICIGDASIAPSPTPDDRDAVNRGLRCGWTGRTLPAQTRTSGCLSSEPRRDLLRAYAWGMPIPRFRKRRVAKEPPVLVSDPRVEGWESVSAFEDQKTAVAWRDQLRAVSVEACCVADHPLERFGRGDTILMVPPEQWSRASEIVDNLE